MATIIVTFIIAFSIPFFGTSSIRQLALRIGFVDAPAARKLHKEPMPMMGGVGIFGGAIVAFLLIFIVFEVYTCLLYTSPSPRDS